MRLILALSGAFVALGAQAEPAATPQAAIAAALRQADCTRTLEQALNSVAYHDLGDGYSFAMVPCAYGASSDSHILFLVAPKTGGRLQMLRFQAWRENAFIPTIVLSMAQFNPDTRILTSYTRFSGNGICGAAGEWSWTGTEFRMTGYWDKPDCADDSEFDRGDRFRVFPPRP